MPRPSRRKKSKRRFGGPSRVRSTRRFGVAFSKYKPPGGPIKISRDPSFPTSKAPIYKTRTGVSMKKKMRGDFSR